METDSIDIMKYVNILRRWFWVILTATAITGVVALAVSFILPLVYEAEANVASVKSISQISLSPEYRTLSEAQLTQGLDVSGRQKALIAIARGNEVAFAVTSELKSELTSDEREVANLVSSVTVTTDGDLIRIKVQNKDPQKAAKIANTWARIYASRVNQLYTENPTSLDNIRTQANQSFQNYQSAETALTQFVGQNRIDALTREITAKQNTINDLYAAQRGLDRLLQDAKLLQDLVNKDSTLASDAATLLSALLIRANAATMSYSASTFNPSTLIPFSTSSSGISPNVPPLPNPPQSPVQLQVTATSLNDPTQPNIRLQIDSLIASLEAQKKQVESRLADPSLQSQVLSLQKELEQQTSRKQELTTARDLAWSTYKTLASKIEEVRVSQQSAGTIVRLAGTAIVPDRPILPKKTQNALIAAAVGFMLSLGIAFVVEFMNSSLRSPEEAAARLQLPVFSIPRPRPQVESKENALRPDGAATLSPDPAFYTLWASVVANPKTPYKTFVIASAEEDVSASITAANLGIVSAQAGKSVILVDANVQNPSLAQLFSIPNSKGWSNLLRDNSLDVNRYLQTTSVKNLTLLPSGTQSLHNEEFIVSSRLASLMNTLKGKADVVVFICPVFSTAADVLFISKHAEGTLLCVSAGVTRAEDAVALKEQLQSIGANLLAVIMTAETKPHLYNRFADSESPRMGINGNVQVGFVEMLRQRFAFARRTR